MRKYRLLIIIAFSIIAISSLLTILFYSKSGANDVYSISSQQQIIDEITNELKLQGVPLTSAQIINDSIWSPPLAVDFTLQSSSNDNKIAPNDPLYESEINHEVNMAQLRGLNLGAFNITINNSKGNIILKVISRFHDKEAFSNEFNGTNPIKTET